MRTEHRHRAGVEPDHVAALRLRKLLEDDAALDDRDLVTDHRRRPVEIDSAHTSFGQYFRRSETCTECR